VPRLPPALHHRVLGAFHLPLGWRNMKTTTSKSSPGDATEITDRVQRCPLKAGISNRQKSSRLGAAVLAPLASLGRQFITDHGAAVPYQEPCNCFRAVAAPNCDQ
jgi:hypothetical protein